MLTSKYPTLSRCATETECPVPPSPQSPHNCQHVPESPTGPGSRSSPPQTGAGSPSAAGTLKYDAALYSVYS